MQISHNYFRKERSPHPLFSLHPPKTAYASVYAYRAALPAVPISTHMPTTQSSSRCFPHPSNPPPSSPNSSTLQQSPMGGGTTHSDHARSSRRMLTGLHRGRGLGSMNRLEEDCFNQLQQELSVIQDGETTTQTVAQQSPPNGKPTSSTPKTQSPSSGTSSQMTPVFLTGVIRATVGDILNSS